MKSAANDDADATRALQSALRTFSLITWNLAGLTADDVPQLFVDLSMNIYWSVIFTQEFSNHLVPTVLENCNSFTYVFPGISAQSRSNAISINSALNRYVSFSEFCHVGGLVALKIGDLLIVLITLHIPYTGHGEFSLEQSIDEVNLMLACVKLKAKKLHVGPQNIRYIGGADFNAILTHGVSQRKTDILAWLMSHGLSIAAPVDCNVISHRSWSSGVERLIDYFFGSDDLVSNAFERASDINRLVISDHLPMHLHLSLLPVVNCALQIKSQRKQYNSNLNFSLRLQKHWKPNEAETESFQNHVEGTLHRMETIELAASVLVSAGKHVKSKQCRYRDSDALKHMCSLRNTSNDLVERGIITMHICKLRKAQRLEFKNWHVGQLAAQNWSSKNVVAVEMNRTLTKFRPNNLTSPVWEKTRKIDEFQWPAVFTQFWVCVYATLQAEFLACKQRVLAYELVVVSMIAAMKLDDTYSPLISVDVLNCAIDGLKVGKAVDNTGLNAEAMKATLPSYRARLLGLLNSRADAADTGEVKSWQNVTALLFPKSPQSTDVSDFRPIAILTIMHKLYMKCLLIIVQQFITLDGWIQYGSRKHYQGIEIVHCIRLLIEKALEWGTGIVILSLDIKKAFDSVNIMAFTDMFEHLEVPMRIRYAILREMVDNRKTSFQVYGIQTDYIDMNRGLRQGSPEAGYLFAALINLILTKLHKKWQLEGLGIHLGKFGGSKNAYAKWFSKYKHTCFDFDPQNIHVSCLAFLDDVYLVGKTVGEVQCMLNDVIHEFKSVGLELQAKKLKWMTNKYACDSSDRSAIVSDEGVAVDKCESLVILGSLVSCDSCENLVVEHRIECAWKCFYKWLHVLTSDATLECRIKFWALTVLRSLMWGLETIRPSHKTHQRLKTTQRLMIRKMLRIKRKPVNQTDLEPWLEWQIRSMKLAGTIIKQHRINVADSIIDKRFNWAKHIARMGWQHRTQHLLKAIASWRCKDWWTIQATYNSSNTDVIRHAYFRPRRWEESLPSEWLLDLCVD